MKEIHRHQTSAPNRFVYDFFCSFGFEWLSNGQTTNHRQPTAATNFKDSRVNCQLKYLLFISGWLCRGEVVWLFLN